MSPLPDRDDRDAWDLPDASGVESLLSSARPAGPSAAFRERVLASMAVAAEERSVLVAEHRVPRRASRRRILPEAIAGAAAALVVLAACFVPLDRGDLAATPAEEVVAAFSADEPPDVHRALELLDARRDLFAAVHSPDDAPRDRVPPARLRGSL